MFSNNVEWNPIEIPVFSQTLGTWRDCSHFWGWGDTEFVLRMRPNSALRQKKKTKTDFRCTGKIAKLLQIAIFP